jgi:hypothetical protein
VTLPADAHQMPDRAPGDQGSPISGDEGRAHSTRPDTLFSLRDIARRARARTGPPAPSADPIGDYLLAEDARTKSDSSTPA